MSFVAHMTRAKVEYLVKRDNNRIVVLMYKIIYLRNGSNAYIEPISIESFRIWPFTNGPKIAAKITAIKRKMFEKFKKDGETIKYRERDATTAIDQACAVLSGGSIYLNN